MKKTIWESSGFRWLVGATAAMFLIALIFAGAVYMKYRALQKEGAKASLLSSPASVFPERGTQLGRPILYSASFSVPWNLRLESVDIVPGQGLQLKEEPILFRKTFTWGTANWGVEFLLQPYRTGESGAGTLTAHFSDGEEITVKIDAFDVTPATTDFQDDTLRTAGEIKVSSKKPPWYMALMMGLIGLFLVIVFILVLIDVFKKRKADAHPTPWQIALSAIAALRDMSEKGLVPAERAVSELTDIIRRYLETRFRLRAERETTEEFFKEMERRTDILDERDERFLKDFLEAADRIKFAKLPAAPGIFENAASRAENLVNASTPEPGESDKKGKGVESK